MKNKILTKSTLQTLTKQYTPAHFEPQYVNERWHKPLLSLRQQADLRKNCFRQGVDPASLGIPPAKENKKPINFNFEGTKYQKNYEQRKAKVDKALNQMPKKIEDWKQAIAEEKAKKANNLPF